MILTFLTFASQIPKGDCETLVIYNIFEGEWPIILVLNSIVFLGILALLIGLCIGLWQGQNGITRGLAWSVAAFLHERAYLLVAQSYVIQGRNVADLGDWRLATLIIVILAGAYSIYEVVRYVIHQAHSGKST